jgi:hypothetical protein
MLGPGQSFLVRKAGSMYDWASQIDSKAQVTLLRGKLTDSWMTHNIASVVSCYRDVTDPFFVFRSCT